MMDFNLAKVELPVHIIKSFDKGELAKTFDQMKVVADKLATTDEASYKIVKLQANYMKVIEANARGENADRIPLSQIIQELFEYKQQRADLYIQNMLKILEYHAMAKANRKDK